MFNTNTSNDSVKIAPLNAANLEPIYGGSLQPDITSPLTYMGQEINAQTFPPNTSNNTILPNGGFEQFLLNEQPINGLETPDRNTNQSDILTGAVRTESQLASNQPSGAPSIIFQQTDSGTGRLNTATNFRNYPSVSSSTLIDQEPQGTTVTLLQSIQTNDPTYKDWEKVQLSDGRTGYFYKQFVDKVI